MKQCNFISDSVFLRLAFVVFVFAGFLYGVLLFDVPSVRAEAFNVTMDCPNVLNYSFTNDTKQTYQYYVTVTDSQGNGLGSTAYSSFLRPGESFPEDSDTTLSLGLVRVPSEGDLTATLWRVPRDGSATSVSSITLANCWPPSLSTPDSVLSGTDSMGTPRTSRIRFVCTPTGVELSLTDDQHRVLPTQVLFDNRAVLEAGPDGKYRSVRNYGVLSIAGSRGWDGMYYYAAWNGGIYDATGQHDFSLTFRCTQ